MKLKALPSLGIAIAFSDVGATMASKYDPANTPAPTITADTKNDQGTVTGIISWGSDNLFPNKLRSVIKTNSKLKTGLAQTALSLIGSGIRTGKIMTDEVTGEEWLQPKIFPEFREWEKRADSFRQYCMLAGRDLKTHYNSFVSVVLTADRKKIGLIRTIPAHLCRLSTPRKDGTSEFVAISAYWNENVSPSNTEKVKIVRLIPDWYCVAETLQYLVNTTTDEEFILHIRIPTDELSYSIPDWYSVVEQGWVDVSNDVPTFKKWVMKNLTNFNHIMYVREEYFENQYPDWRDLSEKAAQGDEAAAQTLSDRQDELLTFIDERLTGAANVGKLISVPMLRDAIGKDEKLAKSIIIEKIENNTYDGKYNADGQEADTQILFAIGYDPSRNGSQPGTSRQGGSDKREAHNISQVMEAAYEYLLLMPYRLLRDFNGFDPDMEYQIRRAVLQTLDAVSPAARETTPETVPSKN